MVQFKAKYLAVLMTAPLFGCSSLIGSETKVVYRDRERVVEREAPPPPGTVQYVWEEPMTDVIDVPAGLDPEGIYYRPSHREVVEIRQGRWRVQKLKNDGNQ